MNKLVVGICLTAVLAAGGIAFAASNRGPEAKQTPPAEQASADTEKSDQTLPGVPTISLPADTDEAKALLQVQQMIAEVTREAMERPRADRMSAEEVKEMVLSRIEELKEQTAKEADGS